MNEPLVYVVPIIDTEGPTTGRVDLFDNWQALGEAMDILTTETRNRLKDSFGGGLKISWFVVDWIGFSPSDPEFKRRGHDNSLHGIWKFYRKNILSDSSLKESGDGIYWHYHHPPKNGSWGWNSDWYDSDWHEYIIGKRMLDFGFFPAVYRAGKYVENDASSGWLEQWIPFDFSSISPAKREFCDWSRSPVNWQPYHPNFEDYQRSGQMKRLVARSLPVAAKGGSGNLHSEDVESVFMEAKEKGVAIFSFHTHDYYKSIFDDFTTAQQMIEQISRASGVRWQFSNALDAMRLYAEPVNEGLSLRITKDGDRVFIASNHEIFGKTPFVSIEYENGGVRRENVVKEENGWAFTIPDSAKRIAAGAADAYGNTDVIIIKN